MNNKRAATTILVFLFWFAFNSASGAEQEQQQQKEPAPATTPRPTTAMEDMQAGIFTEKGADTCIKCHDEDSDYPVFDIFKTKHGAQGDKRSPFAQLQCEACHGPGVAGAAAMQEALDRGGHVGRVRRGEKRPPILNFGLKSDEPVEKQNSMCLTCHHDDQHINWKGSSHENADIACASCHQIHISRDPVLTDQTQPEVCFECHKKQREEFYLPSVHPVRFGQMACTECHNTHGSAAKRLMVRSTLNQTCYSCHAEKRGPFAWEHAPVPEDCALCHKPHGSVNPALLRRRPPYLCQMCHSSNMHASAAYTTNGLPGGTPSGFLLGGSCLNCHSQVHGSNHPSGVKLMR